MTTSQDKSSIPIGLIAAVVVAVPGPACPGTEQGVELFPEPNGPLPFIHHSYVSDHTGKRVARDDQYGVDLTTVMGLYESFDVVMTVCFGGGYLLDVRGSVPTYTFASASAWHQCAWSHDVAADPANGILRRVDNFSRAWDEDAIEYPVEGMFGHYDVAWNGIVGPPAVAKDPFAIPSAVPGSEEWPQYSSPDPFGGPFPNDTRKLGDAGAARQFAILVAWGNVEERHEINIQRVWRTLVGIYGVDPGDIAVLTTGPGVIPARAAPVEPEAVLLPAVFVDGANTRTNWVDALAGDFFATHTPDGNDKLFIYNTGHGGHLADTPVGEIILGPFGQGVIRRPSLEHKLHVEPVDPDVETTVNDGGSVTIKLALDRTPPLDATLRVNGLDLGDLAAWRIAAESAPEFLDDAPQATAFYETTVDYDLLSPTPEEATIEILGLASPVDPVQAMLFRGGDQSFMAVSDGVCPPLADPDVEVLEFADDFDGPCLDWGLQIGSATLSYNAAFDEGALVIDQFEVLPDSVNRPRFRIFRSMATTNFRAETLVHWDQADVSYEGEVFLFVRAPGSTGMASVRIVDWNSGQGPHAAVRIGTEPLVSGPNNLPLSGTATLRVDVRRLDATLSEVTGTVLVDGQPVFSHTDTTPLEAIKAEMHVRRGNNEGEPFGSIALDEFSLVNTCPGDLDGDGLVGINDFLDLLAGWGLCPDGTACPADIDGDGEVEVDDFLALLAAWGPCP